jgi:hypothetical protein
MAQAIEEVEQPLHGEASEPEFARRDAEAQRCQEARIARTARIEALRHFYPQTQMAMGRVGMGWIPGSICVICVICG